MGIFDSIGSAIGGLAGGILGGSSGGSRPAGSTTVVNSGTQDIPEWLKPYVTGNLNSAQSAVNGLNPSQILSNSTPQMNATINGAYLNSNPYLDQIYQHGANLIGQNVDSRFEAAGRYGSGSHASSLAEPLSGLYGSLYGNNYQQERGRQAAATMGAPAYASGAATAALSPYSAFANLIPGLRNSSGSTSTPYFTNPLGNIAGGALLGSQLGGGFGGMFGGLSGLFGGGGAIADAGIGGAGGGMAAGGELALGDLLPMLLAA